MNVPLYVLFFCSGISGLIYQVVWIREFGNVFGNTVYSAALVIAVWFLFFSGFRWTTKGVVVLLVASIPFVAQLWIRKIKYTGTMGLIIVWRSDLDPVKELVTLIKTQRAFELNSQSIQTADQALQTIANLRRF